VFIVRLFGEAGYEPRTRTRNMEPGTSNSKFAYPSISCLMPYCSSFL
jgi:hypothetical protein